MGPMIKPDQKTRPITPMANIAARAIKDHSLADKNTEARPSRRDAARNIMVTSTSDENGADLSAMAVCTAMVAEVPKKVRPEIAASQALVDRLLLLDHRIKIPTMIIAIIGPKIRSRV